MKPQSPAGSGPSWEMLIQGPAVLTPQPTAHSCLACGDATGIHVSDKRPHVPPVNSYVLLAPARKILSDSKTHCGPVPLTSDAPRVLETHNVPLPSCYHQPLSSNKARYLGQENQEFPESHPHLYLVVLGKRSQGEPARRGPLQFKVCAQAGGGWILAGVQSAPCQTPRVAPLVTQLPPSAPRSRLRMLCPQAQPLWAAGAGSVHAPQRRGGDF